MKIYKDLLQGSTEWLEIKHAKVGGSRLAKIMTKLDKSVRECSEYYSILAEHMEDFDPFEVNFQSVAMARGNEFEPLARKEYERIYGVKVEQYGWIQSDEIKIAGISPDGHIPSLEKAIEIKCPSDNTHVMYMLNPAVFLEEYCWQMVDNYLVIGVKSVDGISFRPENKIKPMLVIPTTKDTLIQIGAKKVHPISYLVELATKRLNELEACIKEDLEMLSKENQF